MKFLKTFEGCRKNKVLYTCPEFIIEYNENDAFCATTRNIQLGAIVYMAELIGQKSPRLRDPKLKGVEVRQKDINSDLIDYLNLYPEKIKNIEQYRSGIMRHFWNNNYNENIPIDIFMEMTLRYTPIIAKAIKNVETLGDIINNFQIIYKELHNELMPIEVYTNANKYNL